MKDTNNQGRPLQERLSEAEERWKKSQKKIRREKRQRGYRK